MAGEEGGVVEAAEAARPVKLVRVVAPHFVAGFETDGVVRRTAPILKRMLGMDDERARKYIKRKGWKASVVPEQAAFEFMCRAPPAGG